MSKKSHKVTLETIVRQYESDHQTRLAVRALPSWQVNLVLSEAIRAGKKAVVEDLIQKGADVNFQHPKYGTPLMQAVRVKNLEMVGLLIRQGADVDAWFMENSTALMGAIESGHVPIAELLIGNGASVLIRSQSGWDALRFAVECGRADMVDLMLRSGADSNGRDNNFVTPLFSALAGRHDEIAFMLLDRGADVNARGQKSWTPLLMALDRGSLEIARELIRRGADTNIWSTDKPAISPLILVSGYDDPELVKLILEGGVDLGKDPTHGIKALTRAAAGGLENTARILCEYGADPYARISGATPTMTASLEGRESLLRVLLNVGADPDAVYLPTGDSLIGMASEPGHVAVVRLLLSRGAQTGISNRNGQTPLWLACRHGKIEVAKILINAGADLRTPDNSGRTPLIVAVLRGDLPLVKLLLGAGSEVNPSEREADLLLALAIQRRNRPMVGLLLGAGADPTRIANQVIDFIRSASTSVEIEIANLLKAYGIEDPDEDNRIIGHLEQDLFAAVRAGNSARVANLLDQGVDVEALDDSGRTPLILAAEQGDLLQLDLLLDRGADVDAPHLGSLGNPGVMVAYQKNNIEVVDRLIEAGAKLDLVNDKGENLFMRAAERGDDGLVARILSATPLLDIDKCNHDGLTALMMAARNGHSATVGLLARNLAQLDLQDHNGETALMMASRWGHLDVVEGLMIFGADSELFNRKGKTASDIANERGHTAISGYIESRRSRDRSTEHHRRKLWFSPRLCEEIVERREYLGRYKDSGPEVDHNFMSSLGLLFRALKKSVSSNQGIGVETGDTGKD